MVDFTDPYYAGGLVVLTKKDGPIKTLQDMDGRKVSVQVGTKSVNYLKEHFRRCSASKWKRTRKCSAWCRSAAPKPP